MFEGPPLSNFFNFLIFEIKTFSPIFAQKNEFPVPKKLFYSNFVVKRYKEISTYTTTNHCTKEALIW